jgi:hypothetical protein
MRYKTMTKEPWESSSRYESRIGYNKCDRCMRVMYPLYSMSHKYDNILYSMCIDCRLYLLTNEKELWGDSD